MPKKKFLPSIFSRSTKQQKQEKPADKNLVTDAVPAPDENSNESTGNQVEEIDNSTPLPSSELRLASNNQQMVSSPLASADLSTSPFRPAMMSPNNMLAVHNTHAENVFQFSNINNLHIGSVYKIKTAGTEPQRSESTTDIPKEHRTKAYTRTVQAMLQSKDSLDQPYLSEISKHLGEGWQDIMRQLKFSEGQIHQATVDFHLDGGVREVIFQLLLDWTRNESNATLGEIASILWNSGHHETVYYMKQLYKAKRAANCELKLEKGFV